MKGINNSEKRHELNKSNSLSDTRKEVLFYNDIFTQPLEKALIVYARKIEKITTALYLVTDVMDPEVPLTQSLRLESLGLLNSCFQVLTRQSLGGSAVKITPSELTQIMVRLEHVISLISIGRIAHHISEMNAQVLITELEKVAKCLNEDLKELSNKYTSYLQPRIDPKESQPILSHAILDDSSFDELEKRRIKDSVRPINDTKIINDKKQLLTQVTKVAIGVGSVKSDSKYPINDMVKAQQPPKPTTQNNDRKQSIINVIRSHKNASMQDITKFVTGYSEKTLQRELVSLIQSGVIKKVGDKRWATYHIV